MRGRLGAGGQLSRGVIVCAVIAAAATFMADHYKAPVMLLALLLGMAMNFAASDPRCRPGVDFASSTVLRLGVALLGARITLEQIVALGWQPIAIAAAAVALTIGVSVILARVFRFNPLFGVLSGGATAICGASAALALSAALPAHPQKQQATTFTVLVVSLLSTAAMIVYPPLATALGLDAYHAGVFLGASIHDVAQVLGAGYSLSPEAGDTAILVKLVRVGLLAPVIFGAALITRIHGTPEGGKRPPLLPWFAVAFLAIVAVNSLGWVAEPVRAGAVELSRWFLVAAIAGLGMKTDLRALAKVGWRPVIMMLCETAFLAGLVLCALRFLPA